MPVTRRKLVDNFVGLLKTGVSAVGTTLVSDNFPSLPDDFTTTLAMPMHICDDSQGIFETTLVTGHATGTTSCTVIRGAHGTTARQWDSGAIVRVGVSHRELTQAMTAAAANALGDTHVGMEVTDENLLLRKQTARQGFHPLAKFMAGGIGGLVTPSNLAQMDLLAQTFLVSGVTSANGFINGSLPAAAFPSAILNVLANMKNATDGSSALYVPTHCQSYTTTAATTADQRGPVLQFRCMKISDGTALANTSVNFSVLALGV